MKDLTRFGMAVLVAVGLSACASSGDGTRGTAGEAKDMVDRAIAAYDAGGMEAFADMTAPSTSFVDRDLYIFVIGPDYRIVAHAADAARVGVDAQTLVDTDGKPFGNEMIAYATEQGAWVDYKFADPLTGADEPKSSWVVRHGGYIFGCGVYKNATMPDAES